MNIRDFADQFTIYLFSQDANLAAFIKSELVQAKYDCHFFADHSELLAQIQKNPCHILIIDIQSLILPVHELLQNVLQISSEIELLVISPADVSSRLKSYSSLNVNQVLDRASEMLPMSISQSCDLIAEKIYRIYQNQQVYEQYEEVQKNLTDLQRTLSSERSGPRIRPFQSRIAQYRSAQSKEELLDIFYQLTQPQSWIFLKYVPTIQTFICVSYTGVPEQWGEGLSYKVPQKEKNFLQLILSGDLPESLKKYLLSKFEVQHIKCIPLIIRENIEGLFISTQDITAEVAEDFSLMSLVYSNLMYESQPKYLDVEDALTGFYNELFYKRILEKEIDRSKRTLSPLSVIKIKIDKFIELEANYGKAFMDEVIKKVAEQIKKTSRLPDYICRTEENEFSLVLTNCHRKGAAIRAERLRQSLEMESYTKAGLKITVSQGISEYPSLTSSKEELNRSATDAMDFISSKGGDKICIYRAQKEHRPDFTVTT